MANLSQVDIRLIRVFISVVENRGYTAAQTDLGMTVSTISGHMATLENRIGAKLCHRGRSGFMLTLEGIRVYEAGKKVVRSLESFCNEVADVRGPLAGILRIGVLDTALTNPHCPLRTALKRYNARSNTTEINVEIDSSANCQKLILDGHLDLAIACLPRQIEGLRYEFLFNETEELYCSKDHSLFSVADEEIGLERLSKEKLVSRDIWLDTEVNKVLVQKASALVNNIEAKVFLILTGFYIGFMPSEFARRWLCAGQMRSIRPDEYSWQAPYYLITPMGGARTSAAKRFLEDLVSKEV